MKSYAFKALIFKHFIKEARKGFLVAIVFVKR